MGVGTGIGTGTSLTFSPFSSITVKKRGSGGVGVYLPGAFNHLLVDKKKIIIIIYTLTDHRVNQRRK